MLEINETFVFLENGWVKWNSFYKTSPHVKTSSIPSHITSNSTKEGEQFSNIDVKL